MYLKIIKKAFTPIISDKLKYFQKDFTLVQNENIISDEKLLKS